MYVWKFNNFPQKIYDFVVEQQILLAILDISWHEDEDTQFLPHYDRAGSLLFNWMQSITSPED